MSKEVKKIVWVVGCYNWPQSISKEERQKNKNYNRYNWCDIDTTDIKYYDSVIEVFRENQISCIGQRCGKGFHVWGDLVTFELWMKIWNKIRPFADPRWAPHTLRLSKKRSEEIWERPIFYNFSNLQKPKPWMQSLMSYLCKSLRGENSTNLKNSIHQVGLDKYFQCTIYPVELRL